MIPKKLSIQLYNNHPDSRTRWPPPPSPHRSHHQSPLPSPSQKGKGKTGTPRLRPLSPLRPLRLHPLSPRSILQRRHKTTPSTFAEGGCPIHASTRTAQVVSRWHALPIRGRSHCAAAPKTTWRVIHPSKRRAGRAGPRMAPTASGNRRAPAGPHRFRCGLRKSFTTARRRRHKLPCKTPVIVII